MTDQPNPTAGREDVFAALHRWLDEREAKGLATYGTSLQTFNGRDTHRDLREELLDALVYEQKRQMERAEMVAWARDARVELQAGITRGGRELAEEITGLLGPDVAAWR